MITTQEIIAAEDAFILPTYRKFPLALVRGEGSYVWDAEGKRYLDYYGGHCVTLLGHCPPAVVKAVQDQAAKLLFYSNVVYSDVRARAAARLAGMAPRGMGNVFFCNSGTEANETALKMARKATGKSGIVALEGDFHGRTLGSLATTWKDMLRAPYQSVLPSTRFVPVGDLDAVRAAITASGDVAAVILEPIQSMSGMVEAPDEFYVGLRQICDETGTLLIFDEVQTGIGRTGTFSIGEQYGVLPDCITLAKSLGSGIPVGATLVSDDLAADVAYGDQGTTFGGGMVAMAAVEATLESMVSENLMRRAPLIFERIQAAATPFVQSIRGRGCLIGLDFGRPCTTILSGLRESGVLAGGSGDPNVMRLMPPINTSDEELDEFAKTLATVMRHA